MSDDEPATRRALRRAETEAEIKALAWDALRESGPHGLSLRDVARQMGTAPSALYRYFPSRTELLEQLILDAFESIGEEVTAAYDRGTRAGADPFEIFVLIAHAYRTWAHSHRAEYALIFSTALAEHDDAHKTSAAALRSFSVLQRVTADAVAAEMFDLAGIERLLPAQLNRALQGMADEQGVPAASLVAGYWCYTAMHGAISLELNGHLPPPVLDTSAEYFESVIRAMLEQIGVR